MKSKTLFIDSGILMGMIPRSLLFLFLMDWQLLTALPFVLFTSFSKILLWFEQ